MANNASHPATANMMAFGQFGSSYLNGNGVGADETVNLRQGDGDVIRYISSITFLEDTQFQALENINGHNGSFSTVNSENDHNATNGEGFGTADVATNLTLGASGQVFPKGITVFGQWDYVELHSGACICYFAPRQKG